MKFNVLTLFLSEELNELSQGLVSLPRYQRTDAKGLPPRETQRNVTALPARRTSPSEYPSISGGSGGTGKTKLLLGKVFRRIHIEDCIFYSVASKKEKAASYKRKCETYGVNYPF